VATVAGLSAEQQPHLQGAMVSPAPTAAVAVAREVLQMAVTVSLTCKAALVAREHRSQPGSLAFPRIWGPIRLVAAAAAAAVLLPALAALAVGGLAPLTL
jgi:hypothetical protein